jgi:hypothetical protein
VLLPAEYTSPNSILGPSSIEVDQFNTAGSAPFHAQGMTRAGSLRVTSRANLASVPNISCAT